MSDHWDDKKQSEDIVLTFRFFMGMVSGYRAAQPPQKVVEREYFLALARLMLPKDEKSQFKDWLTAWSDEQIKPNPHPPQLLLRRHRTYRHAGFVFGFMLGLDELGPVSLLQVLKQVSNHAVAEVASVQELLVNMQRVVVSVEGLSPEHNWLQLEPTTATLLLRLRLRREARRQAESSVMVNYLPSN